MLGFEREELNFGRIAQLAIGNWKSAIPLAPQRIENEEARKEVPRRFRED
jgi:hypothetical protein